MYEIQEVFVNSLTNKEEAYIISNGFDSYLISKLDILNVCYHTNNILLTNAKINLEKKSIQVDKRIPRKKTPIIYEVRCVEEIFGVKDCLNDDCDNYENISGSGIVHALLTPMSLCCMYNIGYYGLAPYNNAGYGFNWIGTIAELNSMISSKKWTSKGKIIWGDSSYSNNESLHEAISLAMVGTISEWSDSLIGKYIDIVWECYNLDNKSLRELRKSYDSDTRHWNNIYLEELSDNLVQFAYNVYNRYPARKKDFDDIFEYFFDMTFEQYKTTERYIAVYKGWL